MPEDRDYDWINNPVLSAQSSAEVQVAFESAMGKYPENIQQAATELDQLGHHLIALEEREEGYPEAFPFGLLAVDDPNEVDVDLLSFGRVMYGTDGSILNKSGERVKGESKDEFAEQQEAAQYYRDLVIVPLAERHGLDENGLKQLGQLNNDILAAFKQSFMEQLNFEGTEE